MTNRDDYFDVYFAKLGIPKPTIDDYFAALEAAGYEFSLQAGGLYIRNPIPQTDEDAAALADVELKYPLAMFNSKELIQFIWRRIKANA